MVCCRAVRSMLFHSEPQITGVSLLHSNKRSLSFSKRHCVTQEVLLLVPTSSQSAHGPPVFSLLPVGSAFHVAEKSAGPTQTKIHPVLSLFYFLIQALPNPQCYCGCPNLL